MKGQTASNGGTQSHGSVKTEGRAAKLMKTFRVLLLVILTLSWIPNTSSASLLPITAAPVEFQNLLTQLSTPKEIAKWMRRNIKFTDDKKLFGEADYWQSPEEFFRHGKGDCEDYAIFAKSVLDHLKVEAYIVSLYAPRGYAHTVVIYKEEGRYNILNEDKIQKSKSETIEDAISYLRSDWTWAGVAEKKGTRGRMIFSLENPAARF